MKYLDLKSTNQAIEHNRNHRISQHGGANDKYYIFTDEHTYNKIVFNGKKENIDRKLFIIDKTSLQNLSLNDLFNSYIYELSDKLPKIKNMYGYFSNKNNNDKTFIDIINNELSREISSVDSDNLMETIFFKINKARPCISHVIFFEIRTTGLNIVNNVYQLYKTGDTTNLKEIYPTNTILAETKNVSNHFDTNSISQDQLTHLNNNTSTTPSSTTPTPSPSINSRLITNNDFANNDSFPPIPPIP
jgi:hypothetical protein